MMTKHHEIKSLIENQPHLCTGHTYIIVDHSGSMRQSDVNGFHNRSAAAYGILALDFIAEQLSEGSDLLESVSVIEMRDEGELILDRQPFDWILFNSLLRRGCESVPRSHGNYNPSLLLVQQLIVKEYNLLRDKMEKEDLPNFNMVFLSDGRPSDGYQNHQSVVDVQRFNAQRIEVLTSLSTLLRDKFSLFAMGVGASFMEFQALSEMVDTVKLNGARGQFIHAGLDAVKMGETMTGISNTMTSLRMDLLRSEGVVDKEKKDFTMRETGEFVYVCN
jgi:hypothetical protein